MKKILYFFILNHLLSGVAGADGLKISYATDIPAGNIGPDKNVVTLTIAVSENNKPVDAKLHIILDSPEVNALLSTDFPIVEGSRLFDATAITEDGKFEMSYMFPIRGQYKLNVTAETLGTVPAMASQDFTFTLHENPTEVINYYIMISILAGFGLISGFILSKGAIRKAEMKATA